MYRKLIIPLTAVASLVPQMAHAQARPDSRNFTCKQAQQFIDQRGAVVMSTGRFTYDRVVSGKRFCERSQRTRSFYANTRDNNRCKIGNICVERKSLGK